MSDLFLTFIYIRGAALLVEAAEMGNPDALYELGARLRVEVGLSSFQRQFFFMSHVLYIIKLHLSILLVK